MSERIYAIANINTIAALPVATVAVIIPLATGGGAYIEDALRSVLNQTYPVSEIIIIDDGSTDNSSEIVQNLIAEISCEKIQFYSQENSGQSSARNSGVFKSKSEYISFLDHDDIWLPEHIEVLIKPFLNNSSGKLGWTYSNLDRIDEDGKLVTPKFLSTRGTTHPKTNLASCIKEDMFVLPSASLISRRAFYSVGGFDPRLSGYEDDDLFLRVLGQGYNNIYIDKALSQWRIHNKSSSFTSRMSRSRSYYMRKLVKKYPATSRGLIQSRFQPGVISDYIRALRTRDEEALAAAVADLQFLDDHGEGGSRLRMIVSRLLKYPKLVKLSYQLLYPVRHIIIKRFLQ